MVMFMVMVVISIDCSVIVMDVVVCFGGLLCFWNMVWLFMVCGLVV